MNEFLRSEAVLRRFIDSLTDYAIVFLDEEGHVVDWNVGAARLKGYAIEDVVGRHFSMFYPPEAQAVGHPERELAVAMSVGRYEEEGWRVRKNGTRFWAHVVITTIYDDAGILRGFGKVVRDFTERKQTTEQSANVMKLLELTAHTDYLTGLNNRRALDCAMSRALSAARRTDRPVSVAMIDLDLFKAFNDQRGHQAGDAYLRQASKSWREQLREEDFIARYGGEEFIVVLADIDLAGAETAAERLRAATPAPLTISIGLAEWDKIEMPSQLIGRADRALFRAKGSGRNCFCSASHADGSSHSSVAELPHRQRAKLVAARGSH